ncbi:MAG: NAD(P)-dependent alcohol dehydrogenase [Bacteroidota bacterium]
MKAIVREKYGSADELKLQEVEKPVPKNDEVLVKVHAVSLNASDVENLTGTPFYIRAWGLFKPKYKILGSDIAGVVEAVGSKVTKFKKGDAVFGDALYTWGGFAEYACIPEKVLTKKPESLTFKVAAALPQSAEVAVQGLRYKNMIKAGSKVLINGAGGGSGSFAIQIAKLMEAEVTGIDNSEKLGLMSSLGADHVIDYKMEDFTKNGKKYDLILDLVASHCIFDYRRSLAPKGVYGIVGGHMRHIFSTLIIGGLISLFGKKKMGMVAVNSNQDLNYITGLIESGKIKPVIDKVFTLEQVPEAMRYQSEGRAKGKVVIKIL